MDSVEAILLAMMLACVVLLLELLNRVTALRKSLNKITTAVYKDREYGNQRLRESLDNADKIAREMEAMADAVAEEYKKSKDRLTR